MMWVEDHSQHCSDTDVVVVVLVCVVLVWTVRDDSSSAAAQCSVGHPLVLHQWTQDAAPQDAAPQDAAPQDAAHRTLRLRHCLEDAANKTLPGRRRPTGCWIVLNMAVEMVLLMVLVCVSLVNSQDGGIRVDCPPVVGVVGETTEISCSFRKRFPDQSITITAVTVTRRDKGPVFWIKGGEKGNRGDRGDTRFNLPSREDPSLQITNTALSDEGLYDYLVVTDRGAASGTFWISVTGTLLLAESASRGPIFHWSSSWSAGALHESAWSSAFLRPERAHEGLKPQGELLDENSKGTHEEPQRELTEHPKGEPKSKRREEKRREEKRREEKRRGEESRGEEREGKGAPLGTFRVDCQSADGVVGETTEISCSLRKSFTQSVIITGVTVTKINKRGERDPVFWIRDGTAQEDTRFNLPSREDPSLQITNTAVSDEGLYKYVVLTKQGPASGAFRISVTAKYLPPSTSTRPEKIVEGGPAEFHCSASGGYPAGTIHWFDGTGTNWMKNATLEITEGEDKLVHLSSRLSLTKINSDWGRFRCVVLNSRFITEGESTIREAYRGDSDPPSMGNVGSAITGVVVIGVIIVGLLVFLYSRRRSQRCVPACPAETDPDPAETYVFRVNSSAHSCYSSYRELKLWMDVMGECLCCLTLFKEPLQSEPSKVDLVVLTLLHFRNQPNNTVNDELRETLRGFGLLRQPAPQIAASSEASSRKRGHRKRCARLQKRGKRAGVRTRLTTKPTRAALPSILLSNVCSLENKLDCIRLQRTTRRESRDCCVFVFTETWLSDRVPDAAIQLDGLASFRADRDSALCGKTRGGGLCVYINTEWCKNSVLVSSYCSPLVEFMIVRCRPVYLPREFTAVLIISVYIPPGATAKAALCELYSAISGLQNTHPDGLFIVAGDFNHVNLKSVLPKFHQHVNFATRGANALDLVYTNIPSAYRAEPRPHLGYSDHISVMLIPAYRPLVRRSKPVLKQVRTWPSGAISALQDCFEHTDWQMFREAATYSTTTDLEEYTSSVTSYIGKCIDDVTVSKTITTRPNQKPWMTAEVRALLKARDSAFKAGDKAALRKARAKLSRGIREAKRAHGQSIHSHFRDSGDARRMWQGIQAITNYRTAPPACDSDASLPDALNHFYTRFETQNGVSARKTTPPPDDQVLCLTAADVRKTLRRLNPRKAAGPDNIPARVLRECADQLTDVFTDIFNISLSSATVPTCLKATTIIPVPKKSSVSCLNDYRPIALTPIIMKCFERLVLRHIKTLLPPSLDPLQFAYRPNRSTDDAISTTLHLALTHLENRDTYVRMLFIDFSSAFNTIIPQHLIRKLNLLGLNTSLSNWILDFLTGRPQSVRIGRNTSSTTTLSTGAPQGCVLSPLLFTLLTHDCAAMHSSNHIIKFADDTTVVGLISKNDESAYREEVQRLTDWCRTNNLSLNVDKTKEMVVDFRRTRRDHSPLHIDGSTVEIVKSTKFLGVHLAEDLTWSLNTSTITKKAQQRLYFLRRLRKAHLPPPILTTFYRGTIESILSSCITAWFGNCTASDRKSLQRVVRTAETIIGVSLPIIMVIYTTRCIRKATSIVDDHTHPSHTLFTLLPSGKRLTGLPEDTEISCTEETGHSVKALVGDPQGDPQGVPRGDPQGVPRGDPQGVPRGDPQGVPLEDPQGDPQGDPLGDPQDSGSEQITARIRIGSQPHSPANNRLIYQRTSHKDLQCRKKKVEEEKKVVEEEEEEKVGKPSEITPPSSRIRYTSGIYFLQLPDRAVPKHGHSPTRDDGLDMRTEDGNGPESRAWSRLPVQTDIPGIDFHSPGSERASVDTGHWPRRTLAPQDAAPQDVGPAGRCPTGRCPTGRCPTGRCPTGRWPTGRWPRRTLAHRTLAPQDAGPQDDAPEDIAHRMPPTRHCLADAAPIKVMLDSF
ncbi:hypothetical protein NFI96_007668 [Prochilodus magdalenae]|nr:hypothetical protein NFI96_007668 [Prochilodus magdalenae]